MGYFVGGLRNVKAIDILPYHRMGAKKYIELNIDYPLSHTPEASKELVRLAAKTIFNAINTRRTELKKEFENQTRM